MTVELFPSDGMTPKQIFVDALNYDVTTVVMAVEINGQILVSWSDADATKRLGMLDIAKEEVMSRIRPRGDV